MTTSGIDTEHFRERLLALRAELIAAARDADGGTVELDQQRQGRLARMDALAAQQMTLAAERRSTDRLRRIQIALERIDAGDYGLCRACGEAIDPRRLELDPAALYCVECASRAEGA